jgi:hypothetical protein
VTYQSNAKNFGLDLGVIGLERATAVRGIRRDVPKDVAGNPPATKAAETDTVKR